MDGFFDSNGVTSLGILKVQWISSYVVKLLSSAFYLVQSYQHSNLHVLASLLEASATPSTTGSVSSTVATATLGRPRASIASALAGTGTKATGTKASAAVSIV